MHFRSDFAVAEAKLQFCEASRKCIYAATLELGVRRIVMIPTARVPFGGAMILAPINLVEPADISVDGVMSIYFTMGVTAHDYMKTSNPSSSVTTP
jgi:uncharacterized membrane protein